MIEGHIASLSARHAQLESKIAVEVQRPVPDSILLAQLKREKLRLKEELSGVSRH